jgi:hypothetical protein
MVVYDINQNLFVKDSIDPIGSSIDCLGPPAIQGNFITYYFCDGQNPISKYAEAFYYNIITGNLESYGYVYNDQFGFSYGFQDGWFFDFEGGDPWGSSDSYINAQIIQPGMSSLGGGGAASYGNLGWQIQDGIFITDVTDSPHSVLVSSNDGCGYYYFFPSSNFFGSSNGVAWYSDSLKLEIASDDAALNQWVKKDFWEPASGSSATIIQDRVFAYAVNKSTLANVYCAAYNLSQHQWIVDSVQSNKVNNLSIINGTVTWSDSSGTLYTRGYVDSLGWGNYNTALKIDFVVENFASPTNGNLVYVRNYTIGSDNILFDFGDGYTTTKKSESHLYKNPNGTYRTTSANSFNYRALCKTPMSC